MADDKNITLEEFRAWLQGVEEMQEDDWAPNVTQWKKIRSKIDEISATPASPAALPASPFAVMHAPQNEAISEPVSSLDAVKRRAPAQQPIAMSPDAPMADGRERVKTPNIDSSSGEYESAFE